MKRLFKLDRERTQITHLFSPRSVGEGVAEIRGAAADGADAAAVELTFLPQEFRNSESFRKIMEASALPYMFLLYRNDTLHGTDEQRQELLMQAADAGAGMIDVMGDLFAPAKDERTRDPQAVARQMKVIEELHKTGSQVIMSSHPMRPMSSDEVLDQLKDFAQRGADVVKIVTKADTDEEFAEAVRTNLRLYRELKTPFVFLCGGTFARIQRMLGMSFGCAITFGVHEYHDFAPYYQPAIRDFRLNRDTMQWHLE